MWAFVLLVCFAQGPVPHTAAGGCYQFRDESAPYARREQCRAARAMWSASPWLGTRIQLLAYIEGRAPEIRIGACYRRGWLT